MNVEERVDQLMSNAFRDHIDAVRFRANYPEDWKLWLRNNIIKVINDVVSDINTRNQHHDPTH